MSVSTKKQIKLLTWFTGNTEEDVNELVATAVNVSSIGIDKDEEELTLKDFSKIIIEEGTDIALKNLMETIVCSNETTIVLHKEGHFIGDDPIRHSQVAKACNEKSFKLKALEQSLIDSFKFVNEKEYLIENFLWGLYARP